MIKVHIYDDRINVISDDAYPRVRTYTADQRDIADGYAAALQRALKTTPVVIDFRTPDPDWHDDAEVPMGVYEAVKAALMDVYDALVDDADVRTARAAAMTVVRVALDELDSAYGSR